MSRYVIVDLEMCKVPAGEKRNAIDCKHEIIQIGAVLLDESLEISGTFVTLVCPEYGKIDSYIEKLTGIGETDVVGAPHFLESITAFAQWLPEDAVLVSWSESDEKQVRRELAGKGIELPGFEKYLDEWIDCQKTFGEKMDSPKTYKLSEALIIADIDSVDGAHDALVDARNTALLFAKMEREPELVLSSYYTSEEDDHPAMFNPFAALLSGLAS